ncbi:TOPRIM nucleotidyl transferase/hydrolase domain-containing protein [Streptomyces sp. NBC_00038]|uniref:TOPRIM nucleotidyl transferase/hydrolase domain-containing protein n=1 Tax=Streptomyces sp. NBC_00038 TaxID=2903615 RepID=UPI00224CF61E|nr:TOPRIM nucleotidyl transferase/hydrolase domain-containing protein [Streptomyces sp. NBC_00038]MCX5563009.1 ATP-dependent endonuclease [Streptomyces sp. NBC_00038]
MDDTRRFSRAAVQWAAGSAHAASAARELAGGLDMVVLVEGVSDQAALEALAARRGRDLDAEGIAIVPLGGATSIGRFLKLFGPQGLGLRLAGLCDVGEEPYFRRSVEQAGLTFSAFYVCEADLEDELIRALGADSVQQVVEEQGELRSFRTFQKQPAQRERTVEQQLRRFLGTHSGRKAQYARALVEHLDPARVPRPLELLLADTT